ncbi:MAG: type II toxin-antitoxin system PemK/MazF family toxin [Candidatus Woesearchaeota archaeon]
MISGIPFKQGDICIVPFPFSNLKAVKQRPVLIISKDNNSDDVITCGITSYLKDSAYSVLINTSNLSEGFIPTQSRIKVNKLFTLEKSIIIKKIGTLNKKTLSLVKKEFVELM